METVEQAQQRIELSEKYIPEMFSTLRQSRYAVERSYNRLDAEQKEILTALADLDCRHKLADYSVDERVKIAKAFRKIRILSSAFPQGISVTNFCTVDQETQQ